MLPAVVGFDWDAGNRSKCQAHGVTLKDIEAAFHEPLMVVPDPAHSGAEQRFKAIGGTAAKRWMLVVFTLRVVEGDTLIRPISARYMHRKEVVYHETEIARLRDR